MRKIAEILLGHFLRRYPVPTRLRLFSYLGRYLWLKDLLEELRPELFPQQQEAAEAATPEVASPLTDPRILGILESSEIRGRMGYYQAETYLGARGKGYLFSAIETTSKRPVVIKEYWLNPAEFTKTEAYQRQNRFQRLAGIQLADGRRQDFRVIQPIEAIADTQSHERCFLVTEARDRAPTLRQHLREHGPLTVPLVREILSQILQTLDFLHEQKFSFPAGAIQNGLVHGNLSLDTVLWTQQQQPFVYLCDLQLWEQCFDPTLPEPVSTQVTDDSRQQDLRAVAEIGQHLLHGLETRESSLEFGSKPGTIDPATPSSPPPPIDLAFQAWLEALRTRKFDRAETARRALMQLAPRSPHAIAPLETSSRSKPGSSLAPLALLALSGLVVAAFVLVPRLRSTQARSPAPPTVSTCCLAEVSAVPAGEFSYTALKGGAWWTVLQQGSLQQRDQTFATALADSQPNLQLRYVPASSLDQIFAQVRSGRVDFAVVPLLDELPSDLLAQEIAYDGLAVVVPFSYSQRQQGLPAALQGKLRLEQVQQLFESKIDQWREIGGPVLEVRRYTSDNPEAIAVFEQRVLQSQPLRRLVRVRSLPPLSLLRQVIRDFEDNDVGSIGLTTMSELWGQCSVYPLALSAPGQPAVQPIVLSNGEEIRPETNLCERKGAYGPDPTRFQTGQYPLSYPIGVVYPRDNRRSMMGKKFVELMRTVEGQQLLKAAGLVPLRRDRLRSSAAASPNKSSNSTKSSTPNSPPAK